MTTFKEWLDLMAESEPWEHNGDRKWWVDIEVVHGSPSYGDGRLEMNAGGMTVDGRFIECIGFTESDVTELIAELFELRKALAEVDEPLSPD